MIPRNFKSIITIIFGAAIYAFGSTLLFSSLFQGDRPWLPTIFFRFLSLDEPLINIPLFILGLVSLDLDPSTPASRLYFHLIAIFERIFLHSRDLQGDLIVALVSGSLTRA